MKRYIEENYAAFKQLGMSTNRVCSFEHNGGEYVVKVQQLDKTERSPFWHMMNDVFGLSFEELRGHIGDVYELLNKNPYIPAARPVLVDQEKRYMVFEQMKGKVWVPDTFPDEEELSRQLGRYIGFNHLKTFDSAGVVGKLGVNDAKARLIHHCRGRAADIVGDCEILRLCDLAEKDKNRKSRNTLIMTDISANQFLFGAKEITACVDIDAYVVGPAEWELEVIKMCVPDFKSFTAGYEEFLPLPESDAVSELFRYIME